MTLRTWRRLLLIRDSRPILPRPDSPRMSICVLCGDQVFYRGSQLQAHHVHPRSIYPEQALDLDNGVMLCAGHHQGIVHNHNAGVDVRDRSATAGWRQFVPVFDRWTGLARNRRFEESRK